MLTALLFVLAPLQQPDEGDAQSAVEQRVIALATARVRAVCSQCDIRVETKWLPDNLREADPAQISLLRFDEVGVPREYQTASVEYTRGGQALTRQVQLFVTVMKKLPVVNKRIERGRTITAADLSWQRKDLTHLRKLPVFSADKITGKAAAGILQKGDMVLLGDLQQVPIIAVGDKVQMIYREKGVKLSMNATARQAKAKGEPIRVYNAETRKTYIATVITESKVIWEKTL